MSFAEESMCGVNEPVLAKLGKRIREKDSRIQKLRRNRARFDHQIVRAEREHAQMVYQLVDLILKEEKEK